MDDNLNLYPQFLTAIIDLTDAVKTDNINLTKDLITIINNSYNNQINSKEFISMIMPLIKKYNNSSILYMIENITGFDEEVRKQLLWKNIYSSLVESGTKEEIEAFLLDELNTARGRISKYKYSFLIRLANEIDNTKLLIEIKKALTEGRIF